jgi:hypothetical protein
MAKDAAGYVSSLMKLLVSRQVTQRSAILSAILAPV